MSSPAPRGRPRKLPVSEQRARVLQATAKVVAQHGMQGATIEQIAREAGVSRQAVYEQFGDRATLFAEVVAATEESAFAAIASPAVADTQPGLRAWARANYANMVTFVADHPEGYGVLRAAERAGDPALTRLRERLAVVYAEAARKRWAAHGIDSGRADRALVTLFFAMTESLVQATWDGEPPDQDALIDLLTEFTVGGVARLQTKASDVIDRLR
ncbi:TetR/AcrR family transcriptional regulator [Amycolatopsis sp. NPDC004772]|uniref:TetR/AcrR family transcriptional regulator n=1 Tax=unclassified Amycolatopsis TaxID=2618356 RepID=UPI002876DF08|nr:MULTISPECIES: TetR/AcrR family transcriptional regulator [unclassified Amycolatopsis]MDS0134021.1 TetR/AcrR family transcriptional regulator [Amycolatopsis sp. 505]MDS0144897.1 TetR/AcrR family transcriptional regulator [Amycolatopsis sp. CM201R]